jgi:predicted nucleic acid-binding protein
VELLPPVFFCWIGKKKYFCGVFYNKKMMQYRIYLDNCCFNRPYDDQTQLKIYLETQAKLHVQSLVYEKKIELVWSFILTFENSQNIFDAKKRAISQWENISSSFVEKSEDIRLTAKEIMTTGIKAADAAHVACAIAGNCNYFITVDKRLLKYQDNRIIICNPIEFINQIEI